MKTYVPIITKTCLIKLYGINFLTATMEHSLNMNDDFMTCPWVHETDTTSLKTNIKLFNAKHYSIFENQFQTII